MYALQHFSDFFFDSLDGERCGETLKSIFENAKDPDRVVVGLVEQNDAQDKFCLEEYCKAYGAYRFMQ